MLGICLENVRRKTPLVHNITNYVTVNDVANALLACGASPIMSDEPEDVADITSICQGLNINIGTLNQRSIEAMFVAGKKANELGTPVVLDPVAAGGTTLRRITSRILLEQVHFAAIRGNASEIRALAGQSSVGSGVDVSAEDAVTEQNIEAVIEMAKGLARKIGSVIAISGPVDIVTDGEKTALIRNGCATMARITGSGCMLTSLIGAFCGAYPEDYFSATCSAIAAMGICGELAEVRRLKNGTGNATFRTDLIDAVFNLTEEQVLEGIRYEVY